MNLFLRSYSPRFLASAMIGATIAAIGLAYGQKTAAPHVVDQKNYQVSRYIWAKEGIPEKRLAEPFEADLKDISISFRMRISAFSDFPNVFATAPVNSGIRMEIGDATRSGLVVAKSSKGEIAGIRLPIIWETGKWYAVSITLARDKTLTVSLDGRQLASIQDPGLSPQISDISVGGGFNSQRTFHGEVRDFDLQLRAFKYPKSSQTIFVFGQIVFSLIAFALLLMLIRGPKEGRRPQGGLDAEEKVALIKLIVLIGFVFSVVYHYGLSAYLGKGYPANTFLCIPSQFFGDFRALYYGNAQLNPYLGNQVPSGQYPFLNLLFCLVSNISYFKASILFFLLVLGPLFWAVWRLPGRSDRFERFETLAVFGLMTYPVLFTLDRGNTEGIVFTLLLGFLWFYKKAKHEVSALFLAMAIAMKGFPIIFLVLFVADRRWKALAVAGISAGLLTLGSLAIFRGGFMNNLTFILTGNNFNNANFDGFLGANELVQRSASLFTGFKIIFILTDHIRSMDMKLFLRNYIFVAGLLGVILSVFVAFRERVLWRRMTVLTSLMILLPQLSADYKLTHILLPCIGFMEEKVRRASDWWYALLFGLLLIPKDYYWLKAVISDAGAHDISIAVFINLAALTALAIGITAGCSWRRTEAVKNAKI